MPHPQSSDHRPTAILEAALYATDLESARRFYAEIVGLELHSMQAGRHVFFRVGQGMLLIFHPIACRDEISKVNGQLIPAHGAQGASHVAFTIAPEQFAAVGEQLASHNVPIESEVTWPAGGRSIYVRDPAGNSVEFASRSLWFDQK